MSRRSHWLRWIPLALFLGSVGPAISRAQPAPVDSASPAVSVVPAPLVYQSDTIITFRVPLSGLTPQRRADIALARIAAMPSAQMIRPVRIEPLEQGHAVLVGNEYMFLILEGDLDRRSGQTSAQLAEATRERLGRALTARARMLSPGQRLRATLAAIAATAVLLVLMRLLGWVGRHTLGWITSQSQSHRHRLKLGDFDFLSQFSLAVSWIIRVAKQVGMIVLVALWVVFVLNRFPETQPWGEAARSSLFGVLLRLETGIFQAIPGIVAVAVIVVIGRFLTRIITDIFTGIQHGTIRIPAVHPETAGATRRLVITLLWLFAVVIAYPLLPGSDSDAFKGVSVFLGLIITLGSSGVVGHMMSGLVLVYSRALQPGDLVRVNDIEGVVTEVGALSVKLANFKKEEFTIPNAVIVGTTVKNYSRLGRDTGPSLTTSVTIGYDAPWRVVHEMLLTAAERTSGIRKDPAPIVIQRSLSDFYVEYQLVTRVEAPDRYVATLNILHQNIQDAFNERGVQIMSPHFEAQPERPVFVPRSKWSEVPGDRGGTQGA